MSLQEKQQQLIKTASDVAAWVSSGDVIDYGFGLSQPDLFDLALAAQKDRLSDVTIRAALTVKPRQVLEQDPEQKHFDFQSWHFSGYERKKAAEGLISYIPFNFGEGPHIYRSSLKIDLLVIKTPPMDQHGYFNFGVSNTYLKACCDIAKKIVIETSTQIPLCFGSQNSVHVSEINAIIEGNNEALTELPNAVTTDIDKQVASHIVPLIKDRSCLQIGIGGMPNAVCSALATSNVKELGIHTEMFVDGMVDLIEAGKVSGQHKQRYRGQIIYAFALGTKKTYNFLNENPLCLSLPVDETNLPERIADNKQVVSINNCLQVDLTGQVASESSAYRHISGTGGQLQFVRGAVASEGGQSFMCLSSRFKNKAGNSVSRIVLGLDPGTVVTTPRTDVMYIVTEYGAVNLKGKSMNDRVLGLINIAHPDDRDQLTQQAQDSGLLSRRHCH